MARPLPVNLLFAGTGAVLLISGLQGKRIADVLKGDFGKLEVKNPAAGSQSEQAQTGGASFAGGGPQAENVSFSSSTFAPSPTNLSRRPSPPGTPGLQPQEEFLKREEEQGRPILP